MISIKPVRFLSGFIVPVLFGLGLCPAPALAQGNDGRVGLIISKLPEAKSKADEKRLYDKIKKVAGSASSQALSLTRTQVWWVPKENVDAVKKAAAEHGVAVRHIDPGWRALFRPPPAGMKLTDKQKAMMDRAKASKATMGVRLVSAPPPAALEHALTRNVDDPAGASLTVALDDDTTVTIKRTSVQIKPDMCIWRGTVEETGSLVTLMWWPGGKMTGTLQKDGRLHSIRHLGGSVYAIVEMSEERMPQEHAPMPERLRANDPNLRDESLTKQGDASVLRALTAGMRPAGAGSSVQKAPQQVAAIPPAKPQGVEDKGKRPAAKAPLPKDIVIDVIVAYTKKAAGHYGDIKRDLIALAIEEANEAFRQSNLGNVKLRLVHAYQTAYAEKGTHFDHVWRFADKGDNIMEEIHGLRDKHRADVAVLVVDDPNGCGLSTRVYAEPGEAFSVVHHECAAATYSLAHEIGHLIGARHDPSMDTSTMPFPYGKGYVNGTKWRDIMSYRETCGGCPRLPVWSSPNVTVKGEPAGTPDQDNARVILEQAARVAAFR
jgi:hypothetical protein